MPINTIKRVNNIVSKKYNLPEEVITKINERYWSDIRKDLLSLEHNTVVIKNLGVFTIGEIRINRSINSYIKVIEKLKLKIEKCDSEEKKITLIDLLKKREEVLKLLLERKEELLNEKKIKQEERAEKYKN